MVEGSGIHCSAISVATRIEIVGYSTVDCQLTTVDEQPFWQ